MNFSDKIDQPKSTNIDNNRTLIIYKIKKKMQVIYTQSKVTIYGAQKKRKEIHTPLFTEMLKTYLDEKCIFEEGEKITEEQLVQSFNLYLEEIYPNQLLMFEKEDFIKYLTQRYPKLSRDSEGNIYGIKCRFRNSISGQ